MSAEREESLTAHTRRKAREAETLKRWNDKAQAALVGRRIVRVSYMSDQQMQDAGWDRRALLIELDDGNVIYPSADDEGNDAGALFATKGDGFPVI